MTSALGKALAPQTQRKIAADTAALARATQSYADLTVDTGRTDGPFLSSRMRAALKRLGDDIATAAGGSGRCPATRRGEPRAYAALGALAEGYAALEESLEAMGTQQGIDAAASAEERLGTGTEQLSPSGGSCDERLGHDSFLDALARRTVAGETAEPTPPPTRHVLSRRVFMRIAGAVALTGGALRVVTLTAAIAQDSAACIRERTKENTATFQDCLRGPNEAYKEAGSRYDSAQALLRGSQRAKQRAATQKQAAAALNAMIGALGGMTKCQSDFAKRQNDSQFNCQVIGPPQPPQPGDQPSQPPQSQGVETAPAPGRRSHAKGRTGGVATTARSAAAAGVPHLQRLPLLRHILIHV